MKKYGLNELREMFLSFFESKGHLRLPSFSLIPQNDASLLLINSGMAPMKPWFTGEQEPPRRRVCTCQKCIRTGDIENIGKTARHGTYFEMLGNFSFGDYFKREAISWSWEFLTKTVGIDPELLYPSIYEKDEEAFEIWNKDIGIPAERVFRFGKKDNFWEHGAGPCGPCSEIYFDRGPEKGCGKPDCTVGCDCDRYIEVWNNVFTQFSNDGNGTYTELTQKNIDTGMGLERLAVVCQGVDSIFDVDTLMNITNKVSAITGATYGQSHKTDVSLRVITDHIRSATMMICDGVLPSNEGRGYVLRRLLRRAARHGKLLGVSGTFLWEVCATVIEENKNAYPDLVEKQDYITRIIKVEEENFNRTIDGGMSILTSLMEAHKAKGVAAFPGEDAFKLYDTYGFPVDLTLEIIEEQGFTLDRAGFDRLMQEQRTRARTARAALGDLAWAGVDLGLDNTPTVFTGYDHFIEEGRILALVSDGELCSSVRTGDEAIIVLDRTPFYAEMGGQAADHGTISSYGNMFKVTSVQKNKGGKYLHSGVMVAGEFHVENTVTAEIDETRRRAVMRAHSATHLLQKALRLVLGDHIQQAGSLVEPDKLRFDFTHFAATTPEELQKVENLVNNAILDGMPIKIEEMPINEAKKMRATALFGEKYGDIVRVVSMGSFSTELCGGTHLDNTAKAGAFNITSEFSVASGVRRIEATVGQATLESLRQSRSMVFELAGILKANNPGELVQKLEQHLGELRELRRAIDAYSAKEANGEASRFLAGARTVGDLKILTAAIADADADKLRQMGDFLRDKDDSVVAVLSTVNDGKITFVAVCGPAAVAKGVKAGELIKTVTKLCGGSGGGKPDSAMGGGKELSKVDDALAAVDDFVIEKLGL
ncbi:alanyl-tRNA synthetase [Sporobacter termitidis DSM 10068]|uniref:Alanine--tRNA ligase n=1 Tax=Sporobacter termitidis DSM 10068 TaxID=1123282 RepID=A0A1M5Y493_9FIRM|nr:alanine--tRNA ligase [Sporobacter termitidis]SHI06857.1 alanyl-tRNA synthetase [Sporobacter termitidis DSM 10068]